MLTSIIHEMAMVSQCVKLVKQLDSR